ncbi:MAG: cation diffusion facilitator family transporter [Nitrospirae bacterium]|nr:cation diffusion facilitator family transporter [Nitrospirota bacterium]MDA1304232.1 cation diffusion facilitator family transporter [Nitrospirota bacterium]
MESSPISHPALTHRLYWGLAINAVIILAEFSGGYFSNSIALMSDAGHNLIDQGSLFLALYAHVLAAKPATEERTFGYHRAGILAAFVNGFVLLITAGVLGYFAVTRLFTPVSVLGDWVIGIAVVTFLANLAVAFLLQAGAKNDLNIRGAFLHMLADAWVSLGVVLCGVGILLKGWTWLDPLISVIIVGIIVKGAWPIFRESLEVLLESTPPGIKTAHVVEAIEQIEGVDNVHDLHIWAVEPRLIMLTCHVMVNQNSTHIKDEMLATIRSTVASEFGIHHLTIQLETECGHTDGRHCDLNQLPTRSGHIASHHAHSH